MKAITYKKASPKRDARRTDISNTALSLFAKKGYHTTTLKDIADTLGMTHPALYYYYKSKEDLLFKGIKNALEKLNSDIQNALSNCKKDDHAERLFKIAHTQILSQLKDKGVMPLVDSVLFGQLSHHNLFSKSDRMELQNLQRELVEMYRSEIVAGTASGQFNVSEPTTAIFSIIGAVSYVAYWYKEKKSYSKKDIAENVSAFILNACK